MGTGSSLACTLVHGATSPAWECDMGISWGCVRGEQSFPWCPFLLEGGDFLTAGGPQRCLGIAMQGRQRLEKRQGLVPGCHQATVDPSKGRVCMGVPEMIRNGVERLKF